MLPGIDRRMSWLALAIMLATPLAWLTAQQPNNRVLIDPDDIGGTVVGAKGPEAGVWVIAETTDLPTRLIKSVVTDDRGRYLIPDLPTANYQVFVRGYGLVDSPRVQAKPGQTLDLKSVIAPDGKAAAHYYPAAYWLSLMEIAKGSKGEQQVIADVKNCTQCHALGSKWTREIPQHLSTLPSLQAWDERVKAPGIGAGMLPAFRGLGTQRKMFSDWTDRIAAGAYPQQAPPRPSGAERNVVITQWDWAFAEGTRSDSVATSEENPRLNANGLVYGVYTNGTKLAWMNPQDNTVGEIDTNSPGMRSLAMDAQGRAWYTAPNPPGTADPAFCQPESNNKYAKYFKLGGRGKQMVMYDPKTKQVAKIPTCVNVDHNHMGKESDQPVYFGQSDVLSWVSTATWDKTRDAEASQGWCPAVVDTNGDGKITPGWTEPKEAIDPKRDHRITLSCYSIGYNPADGSLWCTGIGSEDKTLVRLERGPNPPETCKAEVYVPPAQKTPIFKSGGVAIDPNGVAWIGWRGSDQVTSFDRRKCKVTSGPADATGQRCAEGWAFYQMSRPTFRGTSFPSHAEMLYLTQIDQHNVLGLGANVVISGTVNSDSLQLLVPQTGKFMDLVVPYPMGFFSRSSQGRIDDPTKGWKGRGLWSNSSTYTPHHVEGGRGTMPKVVKFQMRPDPLAK